MLTGIDAAEELSKSKPYSDGTVNIIVK